MKTLDRKRSFGDVQGDSEGRRYHQDGIYFDADGNQWRDPNAPAPAADDQLKAKGRKPAATSESAAPAADDQLSAQLNG